MTRRQKGLLALGTAGVALLCWRLDANAVQAAVVGIGWGMALILAQEVVAHVFNALGWRFAFAPADARAVGLRELVRVRIAGDAVNYLTPTATLGGEVARVGMLRAPCDGAATTASVVVAKFTQTFAQAVFIVAGVLVVASGTRPGLWPTVVLMLLALALAAVAAYGLVSRARAAAAAWHYIAGPRVIAYVRAHPARVGLSALMFGAAYAWGVLEAYWICRFLGLPVSVVTAAMLEVLSITIDGLLFVVPAKIGTQEGGKVAAFATLGLPLTYGLAFGIVRHVRELAWAALGILLCYADVGRAAGSWRLRSRAH